MKNETENGSLLISVYFGAQSVLIFLLDQQSVSRQAVEMCKNIKPIQKATTFNSKALV